MSGCACISRLYGRRLSLFGGSLFWSKASWLGKLTPSGKGCEELELEQSKQIQEACSKREGLRRTGIGAKQADQGSLLQVWRQMKSWNWSKASWLGKLAPRVEIGEKLQLEESKLVREACSKREGLRRTGIGAKQADLGSLLQEWRLVKSCSWRKASWLGKLAPSGKRKKKNDLEQERKNKRFAPSHKKYQKSDKE